MHAYAFARCCCTHDTFPYVCATSSNKRTSTGLCWQYSVCQTANTDNMDRTNQKKKCHFTSNRPNSNNNKNLRNAGAAQANASANARTHTLQNMVETCLSTSRAECRQCTQNAHRTRAERNYEKLHLFHLRIHVDSVTCALLAGNPTGNPGWRVYVGFVCVCVKEKRVYLLVVLSQR